MIYRTLIETRGCRLIAARVHIPTWTSLGYDGGTPGETQRDMIRFQSIMELRSRLKSVSSKAAKRGLVSAIHRSIDPDLATIR
jgi:hypothetical protein